MYLKRLEIQGFKSFAARNVFEFGPGITAVVGPNGSGKSNLADALRWVLGEQNPRALRSRKSEEIVFSGGRQRPPAGFAEVTIVLDNTDNWLPIGFDEVVFTRRVHRSGESEYLVNRARVRLKDLLDLLSRGQVGQNSYAIMGQGLVDSVLNLQPFDRRSLIEEAADVRTHRLKITDAVDRLSSTRDNLDRVDLLVGEIAPRLQQLEAQARRAAEHADLSAELAQTVQLVFTLRWRQHSVALTNARALCAARTSELEAVKSETDRHEEELPSVRAELHVQRDLASRREAAVRDLDDALRRTEQRAQQLDERLRQLATRRVELQGEIGQLEQELADLREGIGDTQVSGPAGRAVEESLTATRLELVQREQEFDAALRTLAEMEDTLRQTRGQTATIEERAGRLQRAQGTFERESEDSAGRRNGLLARLRKQGADTLRGERELAAADGEASALAGDLAVVRRQAHSARDAADRAEHESRALTGELDAARSRLELLTRLREEHLGSNSALHVLTDLAARVGPETPPRLLAVLSHVLRVQKGLEQAIEAALEDQLDGIIVQGNLDVQAAVRALRETAAGRATLVPLTDLKPVHALNLSSERGVVGVASRLIKCDARYRELVDTLLGRVIVVEDLATGQAILKRGLGTVVTLDGTAIRPTGIVTTGRAGPSGLALGYQQGLDELPPRIAELRAEHAARGAEAARARDQARTVDARMRELEARFDLVESRRRRLRDDLAATRGAIAALGGEAVAVRGALDNLRERRPALEAEARTIDDERRRQAQYVRSAQILVDDARRTVEQVRGPVNDLRAQAARAEAARTATEQQELAVARLAAGRRQAYERTVRTLESRRVDLQAREADSKELEADRDAAAVEVERLQAQILGARALVEPAREELLRLDELEHSILERLDGSRADLFAAQGAVLEAETALGRANQALEQLQEQMEAEGYVLEEGAADRDATYVSGPGTPLLTLHAGEPYTARPAMPEDLEVKVRSLRSRIRALGPVNAQAEADFCEARERHDFLSAQVDDLRAAEVSIQEALEELRQVVRERFRETFHAVNTDFGRYFKMFFGGGTARLALTEPEDYGESGVDILAQPPGKRQQHLQLLSGGERSMTAVALLFALLEANPAPFCVLDEVDAALDEANVGRFSDALGELSKRSQFVLITHNRHSIQAARTIYGISMGGDGVSSVLSLRLEDVPAGA